MSGATKKITTVKQFEIMIDYLENHADMVTRCFSGSTSKASLNGNWLELARIINSEGPPTRDANSWKKVWADYKNKIKKKIRKTHVDLNLTGGSTRTTSLSPLEERVVQLTGMTGSIIGVEGMDEGHEPEQPIVFKFETMDQIVEPYSVVEPQYGNRHTPTIITPRTQRRHVIATNRLFEELKNQGKQQEAQAKKQVEFQAEVVNLIKESNLINNKRLLVEEKRLAVAERLLALEEEKMKLKIQNINENK